MYGLNGFHRLVRIFLAKVLGFRQKNKKIRTNR
jgi:hypothetical protein